MDLSETPGADGNHYPSASAAHGEVDRVVQQIQWARRESATADRQAATHLFALFSKEALLPKLIAELELC